MKTKILQITIIVLLIGTKLFAQNTYQTFSKEGFRVKCGCNLYVNSLFIQMAKEQGNKDIIAAYICAENKDDPSIGVIININIYDESKSFQDINPSFHEYFRKKCLEQYAKDLANAGISYNYTTYQGVSALEYNFDQQGLPTKAIYFFRDKKSYLLQVATRNNLAAKYYALKSSFEIL